MFSFSPATFRHVVRASALYDLVVAAPFATPWSFAALRLQLSAIDEQLGGASLPPFAAFHVLIACLLGSIVLVWSTLRLVTPEARFGRYDAAARLLFSTWMIWAWTQTGAPILWLFIVPEALWGIVQFSPLKHIQA